MKKTVNIAFCGMMAALGTAILLLAYFPYFTYAIPAVVGFLTVIVYVESGAKGAISTYITTAVLALLFAEPEAKLMYVLLFGYYPLLKVYIEKIKLKAAQYLVKFAVFNASLLAVYGLFAGIVGIEFSTENRFGVYGIIGLTVLANLTFLLYDVALVRVAGFYMQKLHPTIRKIFK